MIAKTLMASAIGAEALKRITVFSRGNQNRPTIINVFRNTVNIELPEQGLLVVTAKKIHSPINVVLDEQSFMTELGDLRKLVTPSSKPYINPHRIVLGGLTINLSNANVYVPPHIRDAPIRCRPISPKAIVQVGHRLFRLAWLAGKTLQDAFLEVVDEAVESLYELVSMCTDLPCRVNQGFLKWVGLGTGFTPSYDDFAGSALGVVNVVSEIASGKPALYVSPPDVLGRTVRASALLFLEQARGNVNHAVSNAIVSFCLGDAEPLLDALMDLIPVGHDSGVHAAAGVLSGLIISHSVLHSSVNELIIENALCELFNRVKSIYGKTA